MLLRILAGATVALAVAEAAVAQTPGDGVIAYCQSRGGYGVEQGPVYGWIWRHPDGYRTDLYVAPAASVSPEGALLEGAANQGFLRLELTLPTLALDDPGARVSVIAFRPRSVVADEPPPNWRVRLLIGDEADWFGPGDYDESAFTTTSFSIYPRGGVEPYLRLIDRGRDGSATDVYRRLVEAGGLTVEFHRPRRGFTPSRLLVSTEMSLSPVEPFLAAARAHFAACDAAPAE